MAEPVRYGLGLLPMPAGAEGTFPLYAPSDDDLMSDAELKVAFDSRKPAREEFAPEEYILDQNPHNSCCPHALVAGAERTNFRKTGTHTRFSPNAAYTLLNGGTDNGAALVAAYQLAMSRGLVPKVPGDEERIYASMWPKGYYDAGVRFRGTCYEVRSERRLATALARGLVVGVAIQADGGFMGFRDTTGDAVVAAFPGVGNHAVLVQDARWRAAKQRLEYDMVNSWNLTWGWKGHAWTYWAGHFAQTNQNHVFYAWESFNDDPQDATRPPAVVG